MYTTSQDKSATEEKATTDCNHDRQQKLTGTLMCSDTDRSQEALKYSNNQHAKLYTFSKVMSVSSSLCFSPPLFPILPLPLSPADMDDKFGI